MIPTVTRPLRDQVPEDQTTAWVSKELLPFLSQVRQAVNYKSVVAVSPFPTSNTGSQVTIWTSADIAVGSAVRIDADLMLQRNPGVPAALTITGLFYNNATVIQEGATAAGYTQNTPGFSVNFLIAANHVELQVEDTAVGAQWTAVVTAQECP